MLESGFSLSTIRQNCVCIEDNPFTCAIAKYMTDLTSRSPMFANYDGCKIEVGTLGAGHASHGMAQIHDQVQCSMPQISVNGRMSKAKCFVDEEL